MRLDKLLSAHFLVITAWLLHVISWFLPVLDAGHRTIRGWTAFSIALSAAWPAGDTSDKWYFLAPSTLSALTTVLFVFGSPWLVLRGSLSQQRRGALTAAIAFVVNAYWCVLFSADLRAGYFLWWASFGLLAIGLFGISKRRQVPLNE